MARKVDFAKTYRFTGELIDKIDARAKELNISKNALLTQILTKALKNVKVKGDGND